MCVGKCEGHMGMAPVTLCENIFSLLVAMGYMCCLLKLMLPIFKGIHVEKMKTQLVCFKSGFNHNSELFIIFNEDEGRGHNQRQINTIFDAA